VRRKHAVTWEPTKRIPEASGPQAAAQLAS